MTMVNAAKMAMAMIRGHRGDEMRSPISRRPVERKRGRDGVEIARREFAIVSQSPARAAEADDAGYDRDVCGCNGSCNGKDETTRGGAVGDDEMTMQIVMVMGSCWRRW